MISGRQRKAITFTVLGICLVAAAVTLNVSWLVINWREGVLIVFGSIFFLVIITLGVINTIFLVREIRRNEQHDSFINAVTHELKTPVASIRLYLQTLQSRELDEARRREFYRIMLEDSDRLLHTIDQVLRASATGSILRRSAKVRLDIGQIARECVELARTRFHLGPEALEYVEHSQHAIVLGDSEELKAAVWNLLDNAVKYSQGEVKIRVELEELHNHRVAVRVMSRRMAQRVLIVEDEQHLAEGLRFNLEAEGFDAEVLDNGDRALERLLDPAQHFDLVVLDVMLPGRDGFAVVSELRQRKHFVPVLMLTARGRPEDVLNGFAAGADDYLSKPTELAILLARIGGLFRPSPWSYPRSPPEPTAEPPPRRVPFSRK